MGHWFSGNIARKNFKEEKTFSSYLRETVFLATLFVAVSNTVSFGAAPLAWLILALLYALDFRYALYSIFFFASFFHPTGFFSKSLFFTLKHVHIAFALAAAVQILKGNFVQSWENAFKIKRYLAPLAAMTAVASLAAALDSSPLKTFLFTANLISIFVMFAYLSGMMFEYRKLLQPATFYFILGVAFQSLLAFLNFHTSRDWLNLLLIHNNQLGVLSAVSAFYALGYALSEKKTIYNTLSWLMMPILFSSVIFSCSRTAWLGLGGGYLFLFGTQLVCSYRQKAWNPWRQFLMAGFLFCAVFQIATVVNPSVRERAVGVIGLQKPNAWRYLIVDKQNFAFLGILRRKQIKEAGTIMRSHFLIGKGLTHEITDFHSLYLTILAGSGIIGFAFFSLFCFRVFKDLRVILLERDDPAFIFRLSAFSSFMAWLFISCLENRLLQYPVWMNLFIAQLFICFAKERNVKSFLNFDWTAQPPVESQLHPVKL